MRLRPRSASLAHLLHAVVFVLTLLAGTALFWPSLEQGIFADDYVALAMMDGAFAAPRHPLDLFNFASGDPRDVEQVKRLGSVPWWAPDDFRVSFMRPLSSALWHVDRALFGRAYLGYHLHSIAAWALLVVAAALLYRRLLPAPLAALALPIFALDHSLHFPVVWLSNRGGLYATAFGALGLLAHVTGRQEHKRRLLGWSALCFAVALAFGEWAFPMLAYVLAYELVEGPGSLGRRALSLLPAATLGLAFILLRAALGYGVTGSGAYVDPAAETSTFLLALVGRVPVFIADMLFNVPAGQWDHGSPLRTTILELELLPPSLWARMPPWRVFHAFIAAAGCALLIALYRLIVRRLQPALRARFSFLLLGGLLALVPVVGSFPSTRLTMAAFLGVAPLVALTLLKLLTTFVEQCTRSRARAAVAYVGVAAGLLLHGAAPLAENITSMVDYHRVTAKWVGRALLPAAATLRESDVYLLSSGEFTTTFFFSYLLRAQASPLPRTLAPLIAAPVAIDVERTADNALAIRTLGGPLLTSGQEHMFRARERASFVGERFRGPTFHLTVERVIDGEAHAVHIVFERSLSHPSQVFLVSTPSGFKRFDPPTTGETVRIPRAAGPSWSGLEHARVFEATGPWPHLLAYDPVPDVLEFDPARR